MSKMEAQAKKAKGLWGDFKKFAFKGNVLDMAVGVIIGGAFGKIVTSVVNDLIMPIFGFITSGADFKTLKWVLSPAVVENGVTVQEESAILYGNFIQNVVDFLIIAVSIFLFLRLMTRARRKKEEEEAAKPKAPSETELLAEIRDLLKASGGVQKSEVKPDQAEN